MVVIGAFARIEIEKAAAIQAHIEKMPGVSTFGLGDEKKVGILVEAEDMDRAHGFLTRDLRAVEGILGVWPVYVHDEAEPEEVRQAAEQAIRAVDGGKRAVQDGKRAVERK